jgi:PTH2 family peptidyl-tRNA hydrolase
MSDVGGLAFSSEIVQFIVVNSGVKMSPGKLAAQVAHSAVKAAHLGMLKEGAWWNKWYRGSYTKIVLKASEYEIRELLKAYPMKCCATLDEGRTEIPKNSLTTLAFIPMPKDLAPPELAKLKLL